MSDVKYRLSIRDRHRNQLRCYDGMRRQYVVALRQAIQREIVDPICKRHWPDKAPPKVVIKCHRCNCGSTDFASKVREHLNDNEASQEKAQAQAKEA